MMGSKNWYQTDVAGNIALKRLPSLISAKPFVKERITEPSAVAPDAKVYVGHKLGDTLNTQFDFSIRRYRASVMAY